MLNHQAEFGIALAEVYDANIGEPAGEVTPRRVQTAPESIQAVDDFQVVMREIRDLLLPEVVSEEVFLSPENFINNKHKQLYHSGVIQLDRWINGLASR